MPTQHIHHNHTRSIAHIATLQRQINVEMPTHHIHHNDTHVPLPTEPYHNDTHRVNRNLTLVPLSTQASQPHSHFSPTEHLEFCTPQYMRVCQ